MATSGQIQTNTTFGNVKLEWSQSSQSVANNTTTITYSLSIYRSSSISSTASKSYSIKINGVTVASGTTTIGGSGTKTIKTGTTTISHNADGTKTFSLSFSQQIDITWSGAWIGTVTGSGTGTLNTIPRATSPTLSATSVNMNASVTINTPRASSSFTHTLTYSFNGATGTIATGVGTSYAWTVPLTLANKIPNATSGTGTITCKTFNGSTLIGTKSVSFTAKVPSSVVPTVGTVSTSETVSGITAKFGGFVQNKSKIKVTITASGAYSSTIKTYKTTFNGANYSGSSFTTGIINKSGTLSMTTTATDSRGRTGSKTTNITLLAYSSPSIDVFSVVRALADGTESSGDGTYAKVTYKFNVASVSDKNDKSYTIEYKERTATEWTSLVSGAVYSINTNYTSSTAILGVDKSYDLRITVTDFFGSVKAVSGVSTAFTLMDFNASGNGIAFGKVSEAENTVEFALKTKFSYGETAKDAIVLDGAANLNDITTPGYYVFSSASSQTITNMPIGGSGSGSVQVIREGDSTQVRQVVTRCSAAYREIWERLYYSNTWQAWLCVYKGGTSRILWTGGMYMTAGHVITLPEPISKQPNGIVLVFSRYANGEVADTNFNSFFVSKHFVAAKPGNGHMFALWATPTFEVAAGKYLYINDGSITGHANNSATGTSSTTGITYTNNAFVLRYVIGV